MAPLGSLLLPLLWQGLVIALATAIALWLAAPASRLRYRLALAALGLIAMAPVATSARRAGWLAAWGVTASDPPVQVSQAPSEPPRSDRTGRPGNPLPDGVPHSATDLVPAALGAGPGSGGSPDPRVWLGTLWLAGTVVLLLRLAQGILQVHHIRAMARPAPAWLDRAARQLQHVSGTPRPTPVLISTRSDMPFAIGVRHPAVIMPAVLPDDLSPEQIRIVLAHELAHVRRYDYGVNLLQRVIEAVFWFHPAVHWLSGVVRGEREHCCDEAAAEIVGDRRAVAGALLALEESRASDGFHSLLPAAGGGSLLTRVERLLAVMPAGRLRRAPITGVVLLAGGASMVLATPARSPEPGDETIATTAAIEALVPDSAVRETPRVVSAPIVWSGELRPGERLRVRNISGPITVIRASGSSGIVRARLSRALPDLSFLATREDDGVTVCALRAAHGRCDADGYDWFGPPDEMNRERIQLTVELPQGVDVTAATFEGDLVLTEVDSDAEARTGSGRIEARLVESTDRRSDRTLDFHTGSGTVRVVIPSALGGELEARLSDGRVLVDPPLSLPDPLSPRLRTRLGPGGSRLRVSSGGGDLVLTRR